MDKYSATISWVGGLPGACRSCSFVVLIVLPGAADEQRPVPVSMKVRDPTGAAADPVGGGRASLGLLALMPMIQSGKVAVWSAALIDIILFLSLGLLVQAARDRSRCATWRSPRSARRPSGISPATGSPGCSR